MNESGMKKSKASWLSILPPVVFILAYFGARAGLEQPGLAKALRIGLALVPVLPFAWLLWSIIKGIRSMDELEVRIHLEALAVAFPLSLVLLMTLGLLELAVPLSPDDWSYRHVWAFLPAFYFFGLFLARRRYR
jgi:hypothetical protein